MNETEFKRIVALYATGVAVVTVRAPTGETYGVTVSSFTSVSLEPPLILFCLSRRLSGLETFLGAPVVGVQILAENQTTLSDHFATGGSDRSEDSGWYEEGTTDPPFLAKSLGRMRCLPEVWYPAGDHLVVICQVVEVEPGPLLGERGPLVYWASRYHRLAGQQVPVRLTAKTMDFWGSGEVGKGNRSAEGD
ncbi:MAG TPA: flavin reductase family protein [Acidobacteriota bacterium]|jgi:3-hydroxy-9,10-secoandrosta-1,3,5(10)-triene-9,17-dione monooxygenase reductase component|nr:flavin reductase family protein [Acidobacteriota bacterium]HRR55883.1 flavin reductase family protein [Acidobacteriota bacterium]HRV06976.1 flavin reductase family protein [Acidobacteriota bacterium]